MAVVSVADRPGETKSGNSIALEVKAVATGGENAKLATAPMREGRWRRRTARIGVASYRLECRHPRH